LFPYWNTSGREDIRVRREILEGWFARFPDSAKKDLRQRFRSKNDAHHRAGFFELYVHELLLRCEFTAEAHPNLPGDTSTHPEFRVYKDGTPVFYIEATLSMSSASATAAKSRTNEVYDTLNRMESPNFFLAIEINGAPKSPIPGAKLRTLLGQWLSSLDPEKIAQQIETTGLDSVQPLEWQYGDWALVIRPIPKSPALRGRPGVRPVGVTMDGVKLVESYETIREAMKSKATWYGKPDLPLVVAVNVLSDFSRNIDVMEGLLGQETFVVGVGEDGNMVSRGMQRKKNGAWWGPKGPQCRNVSAALVTICLDPWRIQEITPELIHNPWAHAKLEPTIWLLPQLIPNNTTGQFNRQPGLSANDLFPSLRP